MKITRKQLRQIIQEELTRELNEDAHESEPLSYADKLKLVKPSDLEDYPRAILHLLGLPLDPIMSDRERQEREQFSFDKENPATVAAIVRAIVDGLAIGSSVEDSLREVTRRLKGKNIRLPDPNRVVDIVKATLEVSSQSHQMPDEEALKAIVSPTTYNPSE